MRILKVLKKLLCCVIGHHWSETYQHVFLPRRKCESCGDEQVYLSGAGTLNRGWIKAKKRVRKS